MTGEGRQGSRAGLLGSVYARITQARRGWYARRPDERRVLQHPVISVGNLVSGGSGKTPVVAALARMLRDRGERPAILTRGYGRREPVEGVLVVSDGTRVLEPVTRSGDEPQMLARSLPGVPVLVSPDRYVAGRLAERQLGATISILDDGFQHVQLERDVDLLVVSARDLSEQVLPSGHLREPLEAARFADALLVAGTGDEVTAVAGALGHERAFRVVPQYAEPRLIAGRAFGAAVGRAFYGPPERIIAVAGIARPERFFAVLRSLGYDVAREMTFRDHHWFTTRDLDAIQQAARESGASVVMTTEKDAMRLERGEAGPTPSDIPTAFLPMTVDIEAAGAFEPWLMERLAHARACSPTRPALEARTWKPRSGEGG